MPRQHNAKADASKRAQAMRARRAPEQERARIRRANVEANFRNWIVAARNHLELNSSQLTSRICEVLETHDEYDRQVRRLLNGEVKAPRASSVFWLGVAFAELGLSWASGTVALYCCGYETEAFEILEQAALFTGNCEHVASFLNYRHEFIGPSAANAFVECAHATRSFLPSEAEIYRRTIARSNGTEKRGYSVLGLVNAIVSGDVRVDADERYGIVESLLKGWSNQFPARSPISESLVASAKPLPVIAAKAMDDECLRRLALWRLSTSSGSSS